MVRNRCFKRKCKKFWEQLSHGGSLFLIPLFLALPSQSLLPTKKHTAYIETFMFPSICSKHLRLQFHCTALCSRVVTNQLFGWPFITSYFDGFYSYRVKAEAISLAHSEFVTVSCLVHPATSMALCVWLITLSLGTQSSILLSLFPFLCCHCCGNISLLIYKSIFFTLTYLLSEQEALAIQPKQIYWKKQLFGVCLCGFFTHLSP